MRVTRKDYKPLTDGHLDRLRADTCPLLGTKGSMVMPAKTVYALAMEVLDLREEVFRLQICETVEQILKDELDDEEDLLAFHWPENDYMFGSEDPTSGIFLSPKGETHRLDTTRYPNVVEPKPEQEGRRLPRPD